MQTDPQGPLAGVRVLDASRVLAGPYCGQILGDLGADVIKLERPGQGDDTRGWGPPFVGPVSAYFLSCNRNKRGITLDLAKPDGLRLFHELIQRSDILLENFKAHSADKLGVSPGKLLALNPRLIICSISGFGRTGPWSDLPGYDYTVQALSGLMATTGPVEGPPCKVSVAVTDILIALYASTAILACLHARHASGHGYAIDLALLDCAVASQVNLVQAYLSSGQVPPRQGNAHFQIVPYQVFQTADSWLVLAVGNDGQYRRFCQAAGRDDLASDPRFATNAGRVEQREILVPLLETVMKQRTTQEWEDSLLKVDVPCAAVLDYAQILAEPQAAARGLKVTVKDAQGRPIDMVGTPFHIEGATLPPPLAPPALGQDTDTVLRELLNLNETQVAELRRQGVV